jgi:hypothetical protein
VAVVRVARLDVQRFWSEVVPELAQARGDLSQIHARADAVRARCDVETLLRFERILERFVWLLRIQSEHQRFGRSDPALPVMSNFRYHLLLQECVLDGRDAYLTALSDPAQRRVRPPVSPSTPPANTL